MTALQKYLKQYAEPESQQLQGFEASFTRCLIVPFYRESLVCLQYFEDFCARQHGTLLIAVINRPERDTDWHWALPLINAHTDIDWQSKDGCLQLYLLDQGSAVLVVDRCVQGIAIPDDQGVGLARKIGNDIGCQLIINNNITAYWLFNSDADALLPDDYFTAEQRTGSDCAAQLFPFRHIFQESTTESVEHSARIHLATQLYELSLDYYVKGLQWARSPYAYHTIGSILCLHVLHYAQVRGFPKRAGAEDFYLLNKLAKSGKIITLAQPRIALTSRASDRVPFGTGPAVTRITELKALHSMPFYDPRLFEYLKEFLQCLTELAAQTSHDTAIKYLEGYMDNNSLLKEACQHIKITKMINHAFQQSKTSSARLKHLNTAFDGFQTLKFLHFIRDHGHPLIPYEQWLKAIENSEFHDQLSVVKLATPVALAAAAK